LGVDRVLKRKLAIGVAVAALLTGGAMAATAGIDHTPTDVRKAHSAAVARRAADLAPGRDLLAAASYLGLSATQVKGEVQAGKSLAQIADATPGRSRAGLIAVLVAANRATLEAALASLPKRVAAKVDAVPGAGALGYGALVAARRYLGLSAKRLGGELRSGKTLAEIASATRGRSEAGLEDAVLTALRERLALAVKAGTLTKAEANVRATRLTRLVTTLLHRRR
jgi:hypothetical protein